MNNTPVKRVPCFITPVNVENTLDVQIAIQTALHDNDAENDELYEQYYDPTSAERELHPDLFNDSNAIFLALLPDQIAPVREIATRFALRFVNVKNLPM